MSLNFVISVLTVMERNLLVNLEQDDSQSGIKPIATTITTASTTSNAKTSTVKLDTLVKSNLKDLMSFVLPVANSGPQEKTMFNSPDDDGMVITSSTVSASVEKSKCRRVFLLLAVHCDQTIMYNEEMSAEEAEERAKQSLTGLTIVSIDFTDRLNVVCKGRCLRSVWNQLNTTLFRKIKPSLVYRDKCCNQRNFSTMVPVVRSVNENERKMPVHAQTLYTIFHYKCEVEENVTRPLAANAFNTGLHGPSSEIRYAEHYKLIIEFIEDQLRRWREMYGEDNDEDDQIIVYHKLPLAIANWLPNDLRRLSPRLNFKFLGRTVSAKFVRTSPHCRFRCNHNVCVCEICLSTEYATQLIDSLNGNTTATTRLHQWYQHQQPRYQQQQDKQHHQQQKYHFQQQLQQQQQQLQSSRLPSLVLLQRDVEVGGRSTLTTAPVVSLRAPNWKRAQPRAVKPHQFNNYIQQRPYTPQQSQLQTAHLSSSVTTNTSSALEQ